MKKRTIKQQVKDAEKRILERNSDFYDGIMSEYYGKEPKKTKNNRTVKLMSILIGTTLPLVAAIVLTLVFLWPAPEQPPAKNYLSENTIRADSNMQELDEDLNDIYLSIDSSYSCTVYRYYDLQYNDTLYYLVRLERLGEKIEIYLYVNSDYEHRKELSETPIPFESDEFVGNYNKATTNNGGIYTLDYTADTEYNGIGIYIEYTGMSLDEVGNFFNFFAQTIKKI